MRPGFGLARGLDRRSRPHAARFAGGDFIYAIQPGAMAPMAARSAMVVILLAIRGVPGERGQRREQRVVEALVATPQAGGSMAGLVPGARARRPPRSPGPRPPGRGVSSRCWPWPRHGHRDVPTRKHDAQRRRPKRCRAAATVASPRTTACHLHGCPERTRTQSTASPTLAHTMLNACIGPRPGRHHFPMQRHQNRTVEHPSESSVCGFWHPRLPAPSAARRRIRPCLRTRSRTHERSLPRRPPRLEHRRPSPPTPAPSGARSSALHETPNLPRPPSPAFDQPYQSKLTDPGQSQINRVGMA